jgi:hypothetical protein
VKFFVHAWKDGTPEWHVQVTPKNVAELVAGLRLITRLALSLSFHGGQSEAGTAAGALSGRNLRIFSMPGRSATEPSKHATSLT